MATLAATGSKVGYDGVSRPVFTYEDALRAKDSGASYKEIETYLNDNGLRDTLRSIDSSGQSWDSILEGTHKVFEKAGLGQNAYDYHEQKGYQDADAAKFLSSYASNEANNNGDARIAGGDYRDYWWNPTTQRDELEIYRPGSTPTPSPSPTPSPTPTPTPPTPWDFEYGANKTPAITYSTPPKPAENSQTPQSTNIQSNVDTINSFMNDTTMFNSFAPAALPDQKEKESVFEQIMKSSPTSSTSPQTFQNVLANTL